MVRPREFDRDGALERAMDVFWAKGFAATSTEDLLQAMGIGRQSLYNTFNDKWHLYLEALETYQRTSTAGHLKRLEGPASALDGVLNLLLGLIAQDDERRLMGCMGIGSVAEFGASNADLARLRSKTSSQLRAKLVERLIDGQATGEIDSQIDPEEVAAFVQLTMTGIQLSARGGAEAKTLRRMAHFAVDRLRAG